MDIPEIRALVAEHLELDSLCAAALVSRSWRDTCMPLIWNNITWTSQVKERPTLEAILTNAQLVRTLTIFTLKLDLLNSSSLGDGEIAMGGVRVGGAARGIRVGGVAETGDAAGVEGAGTEETTVEANAAESGSGTTAVAGKMGPGGVGRAGAQSIATTAATGGGFPFAPCHRIEELNLQLNIRQNKLWEHLTDLVRHNPGLKSLSVFLSGVPPTLEFMQALARTHDSSPLSLLSSSLPMSYSSPSSPTGSGTGGLKTFATMFLDLNKETTEALLDLATQLESLQLNGATTVDPGSLDRWPIFPNMKILKLGLNSGITPYHQLQIIQRCPQLESLAWDLEESAATGPVSLNGEPDIPPPPNAEAYYNYRFPTAAVCQLFEAEFCPALEKLTIAYPGLSDQELARIATACPRLTLFEVFETGFGRLAFQAMTRHFVHLTRLDIRRCAGVTSPMAQQILTSCPRLVFFCGDALHARDIVGFLPPPESQTQDGAETGTGAGAGTEATPLNPQDWVCTELAWLTLYICGLENAPPTWLPIVLHQLSRLTCLDFLTISPTGPEFDGTKDGLPLSLSSGLGTLSTLTNLERFCFHGLSQEMKEQDVEWMVKAWPKLVRVEGVVHPEREQRMVLEPVLRREGIEVCGYFGDDDGEDDVMGLHVIVSEDEDEEVEVEVEVEAEGDGAELAQGLLEDPGNAAEQEHPGEQPGDHAPQPPGSPPPPPQEG
ncbi:hypothetical protein BGZ95_000491 [Linnemannia exigua]|uniref:F-box domain-containing protein n=1 Tax=Linnemannia exigua TaxID=604196 RepID=A0AAD4D887_9FUNG|nr:hypothetical protein BGZ95_000491 [Linnemannia exigua]